MREVGGEMSESYSGYAEERADVLSGDFGFGELKSEIGEMKLGVSMNRDRLDCERSEPLVNVCDDVREKNIKIPGRARFERLCP